MSELQQYYSAVCNGYWKAEDPSECGCRGSGWFLSDVDTVHQCSMHYTGQPHPEYDEDIFSGPVQQFAYVPANRQLCEFGWDEDIIPF